MIDWVGGIYHACQSRSVRTDFHLSTCKFPSKNPTGLALHRSNSLIAPPEALGSSRRISFVSFHFGAAKSEEFHDGPLSQVSVP